MTVVVSFLTAVAGGAGSNGVYKVRAQERLAIGSTTINTSMVGEIIIVGNGEAGMIAVAFGTAPDAAATAESSATSAGFPVSAGAVSAPIVPGNNSSKINVKAVA